MSEKKSWDIQPKRRSVARVQPQPVPQPRRQPALAQTQLRAAATQRTRTPTPPRYGIFGNKKPKEKRASVPAPQPALRVVRPVPATVQIPQGKDREPLRARRRRARKRTLSLLLFLIFLLIAGTFGSLWLPAVRIQDVQTGGSDASGMQQIAASVLAGTYHYVVPRNSIFFFPENAIRSEILARYPDISDVSISRVSFTTIAIVSIPREAVLLWCGPTYTSSMTVASKSMDETAATSTGITSVQPACYNADAQGIIFAPVVDEEAASSTAIKIYDPLSENLSGDVSNSGSSPLGAALGDANMIPNALQFVKAIESLGVPITTLVIRGDEADLYAQSGTRITYVLGQEEVSAQLAAAAFPSLNINDGSLEYVDLRFAGKVYYKKVGAAGSSEASSTSSL